MSMYESRSDGDPVDAYEILKKNPYALKRNRPVQVDTTIVLVPMPQPYRGFGRCPCGADIVLVAVMQYVECSVCDRVCATPSEWNAGAGLVTHMAEDAHEKVR